MSIQFTEPEESWLYKHGLNFLFPLYIIVALLYMVWRFQNASLWDVWYAYPLLFIELYSILFTVSHLFTTRKILNPVWQSPLNKSSVDIFITTYNEPEEIVKMTALGALQVRGRREVYILDDGNRPSIKKLANLIGTKYVTRTTNEHAKAGNMNNGIKHSDAEFMIFLDCDHVPQPNFIERTLGYFNDRNLAFVQTPQIFYNSDSIQFRKTRKRNLWNEQSMFYESIQPAKNLFNAAFFCGSGSMLRRISIDSVGGFATGTATEDIHTSLRLHAKGWDSVFVNEQLAHGIAADDLSEYHKQRVRWGAGSLGLLFRSPDSPLRAKGLSIMQRLCYINSTAAFLGGLQRLVYILLPAGVILSLPFQDSVSTIPVASYLTISLAFVIFSYYVTYLFSRGTFHPLYTEQYNIANIFPNILAMKGIINVQKKFKVSIKQKRPKVESNAYRALLIIWTVTFLATLGGLEYWFMNLQNSFSALEHSIVGVALFWNIINLYFVGSILWFVNFHNEKNRSKHSVIAGLRAKVSEVKIKAIELERLSLRGAEIISPEPIYNKTFNLIVNPESDTGFALKAKINDMKKLKNGKYRIALSFPKLTISEDEKITLLMFNDLIPAIFRNDYVKLKRSKLIANARDIFFTQLRRKALKQGS